MGVAPDFSYQLAAPGEVPENQSAFEYVHRSTGNAEIYFVRNTQIRDLSGRLSFRVRGRAPELWNADDGSITPASVYSTTGDGRTEIPLSFPARGSVFVVFQKPPTRHLIKLEKDGSPVFSSIRQGEDVSSSRDGAIVVTAPGTYTTTDFAGAQESFVVQSADLNTPVIAPWTLSFPGGWGAPRSVPWDHFQSWTESSDPGIRYFSGTAVYRTTLRVPAGLFVPGRELWLQLGQVREIATVLVNGHPVETLWRRPFAARVDDQLRTGENTIEVKVSNLWPNRLIGDLQSPSAEPLAHTNVHAYTRDSPLLPSGILQPVTLVVGSVLQR
jgi:hypothetical protein